MFPHLVCQRPQSYDAGRALHLELDRAQGDEARGSHYDERCHDESGQLWSQHMAVGYPPGEAEDPEHEADPSCQKDGDDGNKAVWAASTSPLVSAAASAANSILGSIANSMLHITMKGSARTLQRSSPASRR